MRKVAIYSLLLVFTFAILCYCQNTTGAKGMHYFAREQAVSIGGQPAISLGQRGPDQSRAQIMGAEILPGRGMNIFQIWAYIAGKGAVPLLASPELEKAKETIVEGPEHLANKTFGMGGPILLPWANRIRGKASPDGTTIEAVVLGKTVALPANGGSRKPGAELCSIHGLILSRRMDKVNTGIGEDQASVTAALDAGDFQGRWPSKTYLTFAAQLKNGKFAFQVTAKNTGSETLPMAIGWHPFFAIASGQRDQVRLRLPARSRALVNNYDDVFPTGEVVPVKQTPYDFSASGGAPLKNLSLDDCFLDLERNAQGQVVAEIIDPAANYGIRIRVLSKEIRAMQAYAPLNRNVIAIEPQFNLGDPFSKIWGEKATGMVTLRPGQSVTYSVEVEVFVP